MFIKAFNQLHFIFGRRGSPTARFPTQLQKRSPLVGCGCLLCELPTRRRTWVNRRNRKKHLDEDRERFARGYREFHQQNHN